MNIKAAFISLLYVVLSGCAAVPTYHAYVDKSLSKEKLALIKCDSEHNNNIFAGFDRRLYITKVDDQSTYSFINGLISNQEYPESAYVEPGRRYINVKYQHSNIYAYGKLWLDAEAGKTYEVKTAIKGYKIQFWIEDESSGVLVGGIQGGEPEVGSKQ